jgi:hypothetical protein
MKRLSAVIVMLALWTTVGWTYNEPSEFMGVQFGISCENAKAIIEARMEKRKADKKMLGCAGSDSRYDSLSFYDVIGKDKVFVSMNFLDNRMELVALVFDSDSYGRITEAFLAKYGKADAIQNGIAQNKLGGTFPNQTIAWIGKNVNIMFNQRGTKISNSACMLMTNRWMSANKEDRNKALDKALKDF